MELAKTSLKASGHKVSVLFPLNTLYYIRALYFWTQLLHEMNCRSAPAEVFREKAVLKHFANSEENTLPRVSFLIKLQPKAYHLVCYPSFGAILQWYESTAACHWPISSQYSVSIPPENFWREMS